MKDKDGVFLSSTVKDTLNCVQIFFNDMWQSKRNILAKRRSLIIQ